MSDRQRRAMAVTLLLALATVVFPRWKYQNDTNAFTEQSQSAFEDAIPGPYRPLWASSAANFDYDLTLIGQPTRREDGGIWNGAPDWGATIPLTVIILLGGGFLAMMGGKKERV